MTNHTTTEPTYAVIRGSLGGAEVANSIEIWPTAMDGLMYVDETDAPGVPMSHIYIETNGLHAFTADETRLIIAELTRFAAMIDPEATS